MGKAQNRVLAVRSNDVDISEIETLEPLLLQIYFFAGEADEDGSQLFGGLVIVYLELDLSLGKCFFLVLWVEVEGLVLMRIVRGMQKSACGEEIVQGWKDLFCKGIGITAPKARTRDKPVGFVWNL
ncbi:hypothetical protein KFK09_002598 [Dendrobium nobile]|uniref:Uncharacterized protein n=1 Tax=Dendrobium nobile TaxID=94219 RepID=A0A8T3C7A4_DENNO|nr:hypothetical protein KFK09_002598 [Dendrobium nobile]